MSDHHPAGPVHVLQKDSPRRDPLTACGLRPSGLVYNVHGGPTSCSDCLEVLAAQVERVLALTYHRFHHHHHTAPKLRTYCGKLVEPIEIGNGTDRPFTCPDCNVNFGAHP